MRDSDDLTEVYETARTLLPAAESFAKRGGIDAPQAEEILMEAADKVLSAKSRGNEIQNLPAYLFTSYKRLILNRIRHSRNEVEFADNAQEKALGPSAVVSPDVELGILVEEIARRMDRQSRFIFDHLQLGYSYKEISPKFKKEFGVDVKENALRSKFSKAVDRLVKEFESS